MESTRTIKAVSKGRHLDLRSEPHKFRCTDPESYLGDEDSLEPDLRHAYSKPSTRPVDREWSQSRRLGDKVRPKQD